MDEIAKHYGAFVLGGIAFLAIIILLFTGIEDGNANRGIRKIVAANMDAEKIDYASFSDMNSYEFEACKRFPQIEYQDTGYFAIGTVDFLSKLTVTDYEGRTLIYAGNAVEDVERAGGYVKIVKCEDASGNDLSANINFDTGEITFPKKGIYTITLRAQDDGYRKSTAEIKVPVM